MENGKSKILTLQRAASAETTAKNSRFLSELQAVASPDEAREVWRWKKEHYDNGGHIVYAFITGPQGNVMGCSDDGEPGGTAGRPVLEVLKGSNLTDVILTVARWFGGTKLGTGGLVRAYTAAAQEVVAVAECVEKVPVTGCTFTLPYQLYELAQRELAALGFVIEKEEFGTGVTLCGKIRSSGVPALVNALRELSGGTIAPEIRE